MEEIAVELYDKAIPNGECLECHLAPSMHNGHLRHYISVGGRDGKKWRVTRLIWTVYRGPIENGLGVLHTCDNPKCIRLKHLFLGTHQENMDDMIAKGRKGEDLDVGLRRRIATAELIQSLREKGFTDDDIHRQYHLSRSTIWNYTNGPYKDTLTVHRGD